ncbi:putative serine/threonine-protein kinase ppk5 [Venturia nashicola]|nr:putative serine/threonine-protein kinase ppk5 [Venturia nashicola]
MSHSESEGEIVESAVRVDKATTRPKAAKEMSIDLHYSTPSSRASTPRQSIEPQVFGLDGQYDDNNVVKRQRSRSPFRHSRGEKRRRDSYSKLDYDDRPRSTRNGHDDRRHKVHIENNRRFDDGRRRPLSYADIDHDPTSRRDDRRRDDRYKDRKSRDRSRERNSRDRSRSPYRHPRGTEKSKTGRDEVSGRAQGDRREYSNSSRPHPRDQDERRPNRDDRYRRNDMTTRFKPESSSKGSDGNTPRDPAIKGLQGGGDGIQNRDSHKNTTRSGVFEDRYEWMAEGGEKKRPAKEEPDYDALLGQKIPDPEAEAAAEVEKRRLRREALKKRLAAQTAGAESGPPTPRTPDVDLPAAAPPRTVSSQLSDPRPTQEATNGAQSHLRDSSTADDAMADQSEAEEPSAGDYDPTMDERENRVLHEQQRTRSDAVEPQLIEQGDGLVVAPEAKAGTNNDDDEDDMFAAGSDDDDDMFSTKSPRAKTKAAAPTTTGAGQVGRKLHKNMLDTWDDPEGYYKIIAGELFDDRYVLGELLGKGVFANVVRATDNKTGKLVAIKIIRNNDSMKKAGMKEVEMLLRLSENDPEDQKHIVRLLRYFDHKDHLCMVFENLGKNLRGVIKFYGRNIGMPLKVVRSYAIQMFKALGLLKKCNILHADLKPDNVLADAEGGTRIKIADLGSAADASEKDITPYLVSRFYRAPEIMIGIAPEYAIDMWSIGCTLFELFTDKILFQGVSNNQMLKSIMECRGKISKKVLRRGDMRFIHFDEHLEQFWSYEKAGNPLRDTIRPMVISSTPVAGKDIKARLWKAAKIKGTFNNEDFKELEMFKDLLDKCLKLDPEERITPNQALMHPFFRPVLTK